MNINGGTVGTKIVNPEDATQYYNFGSVFGGGKGSTDNIEGISAAGTTQGDVEVHLNKTPSTKGAIVNQVFGCNDMNGSPKGDVTVHVYATQSPDKDNISTKPAKGTETFDVEAVYGGGNLAAYEPEGGKNTTKSTKVIIDGCGLTSIRQVYGGGNAASTPATNVEVNGTYEVLELFGGGNGFDKLPDGRPNPGANVGYKNYTVYEQDSEDNWIAKDDSAYDTKEVPSPMAPARRPSMSLVVPFTVSSVVLTPRVMCARRLSPCWTRAENVNSVSMRLTAVVRVLRWMPRLSC